METANWNRHEIPFVFTAQWRRLMENKCWQGYVAAAASHYAPTAEEYKRAPATLAEAWQFLIGASSTAPPSNRPPRDSSGFCSHYDVYVTLVCVNIPTASLLRVDTWLPIFLYFCLVSVSWSPWSFLKPLHTELPKVFHIQEGVAAHTFGSRAKASLSASVPGQSRLQRESLSQSKQQQIAPVSSQARQGSRSSFSPVDLHLPLLLFCLCVFFTSLGFDGHTFFFLFYYIHPWPSLTLFLALFFPPLSDHRGPPVLSLCLLIWVLAPTFLPLTPGSSSPDLPPSPQPPLSWFFSLSC